MLVAMLLDSREVQQLVSVSSLNALLDRFWLGRIIRIKQQINTERCRLGAGELHLWIVALCSLLVLPLHRATDGQLIGVEHRDERISRGSRPELQCTALG